MDRSRTLPRRAAMIGAAGGAAAFLALRACAARAEAGPLFVVCRVHPAMGAGKNKRGQVSSVSRAR